MTDFSLFLRTKGRARSGALRVLPRETTPHPPRNSLRRSRSWNSQRSWSQEHPRQVQLLPSYFRWKHRADREGVSCLFFSPSSRRVASRPFLLSFFLVSQTRTDQRLCIFLVYQSVSRSSEWLWRSSSRSKQEILAFLFLFFFFFSSHLLSRLIILWYRFRLGYSSCASFVGSSLFFMIHRTTSAFLQLYWKLGSRKRFVELSHPSQEISKPITMKDISELATKRPMQSSNLSDPHPKQQPSTPLLHSRHLP